VITESPQLRLDQLDATRTVLQAENEALKRDKGFLAAVVQSSWDGILVLDPLRRVSFANPAMEQILGHRLPTDLELDELAASLFPGDGQAAEVLATWEQDVISGRPVERTLQVTRASGDRRWCRFQLNPTPWGVVVNGQDVHQRHEAQVALGQSEERMRLLFDAAAVGLAITTLEGRFESINPAFCRLLGYSAEELAGLSSAAITHPQDIRPGRRQSWQVMAGQRETINLEKRYLRKDGTPVWCHTTVAWMRDEEDRPLRALVMVQDISERKRMELELLQSERLESLGVLAGGIAHDFNNYLTGLLGSVALARELCPEGSVLEKHLERAEVGALRARDLTQQLLAFARGGGLMRTTLSLPGLLLETAELTLQDHAVGFRCELPDDLWAAHAERSSLGQVFQNLVLNAAQAMPDGGLVVLRARNLRLDGSEPVGLPEGRYLLVEVEDKGVGLDLELRARIFEPFFTTKRQGTGLGLSSAWAIVQSHGGTILVDSEAGMGSTFRVFLPAADSPTEPVRREPAAGMLQGGRVLLMDDDLEVLRVVASMVRSFGLQVDEVRDGEEAVLAHQQSLAVGDPYQAMIFDITIIGGMGGLEAIEAIRRVDTEVRIILATGYTSKAGQVDIEARGVAALLSKPFTLRELATALGRALGS